MRRLVFMIWKELLELRQDKRMLRIVFVAPILQLIVLGYAATTDVKNVPIVVVDADRSTASRDLIRTFDASPYFTVTSVVSSVNEITPYLESGRAWMALVDPGPVRPDGGRRARRRPCRSWPTAPTPTPPTSRVGYATNLVAAYAQDLLAARSAGRAPARRPAGRRPRLVQPAAREQGLHDPGRARAAADRDDHRARVDGDRAREGDWGRSSS